MEEDLLFYSRDQVIEMLDYLARGMTGYMVPKGTSPAAGEHDKPVPAEDIMNDFVDRVRRMKSFCEVDGLWPPRSALVAVPRDDTLPHLQLTAAEPAVAANTPGAVSLDEVQTLTRTLRYMFGLSEHPASNQPVVLQVEGLLPRAIQLGDGWRLVESGRLQKCDSVSSEALLRLFGKLNAWDVEDKKELNRTLTDPHRTQEIYAKGRQMSRYFHGSSMFRYHRTDPYRPMRPDKYGDWLIVGERGNLEATD